MAGCPKCGSQAFTASGCVLCGSPPWPVVRVGGRPDDGQPVPDPEPWWAGSGGGGDHSLRRLQMAWQERDRQLDGGEGVGPEAKVYRCKECEETFPTCQALAGHVNHHRHEDRLKAQAAEQGRISAAPRDRKAPPTAVSEAALWADPPAAPGNGRDRTCPLCLQAVPGAVGVLAEQFQREGVEEELATRLAVRAFGLLRVPGG